MREAFPLRYEVTAAPARRLSISRVWPAFFILGVFALHIVNAGRYGYQRDELYFITCARHLAWGYVDQPPMIAVITKAAVALFGTSLYALRFFPALAAAGLTAGVGALARRLGGGTIAQGFAMLAVAVAPFYLAVGSLLTINAFEPLFWTAAAWIFIDLLDGKREPRRWAAFGVVVALGILTKYTMGMFVLSLCAALLALPERRLMREVGFWVALATASMLIAPNVWWQHTHGWPQYALLLDAMNHKDVPLGPLAFGLQQILMVNPLTLPMWIAGLLFFSRAKGGRYRVFFVSYALLFVAYVLLHAKIYYLASIYPLLFAAGACALEPWLTAEKRRVAGYAGALALIGALLLPQAIPVLPLPVFLAYQRLIDFHQFKVEEHPGGRVPQWYADMLGWDALVASVAQAYRSLPAARRARTAIWMNNYGQAAAVDLLGEKYGLPKAISGHNSYYLWGPRDYDGSSVIAVGVSPSLEHAEFAEVRRVGTFIDAYVLPDQNHLPIVLCARPREPLATFWPRVKAYW